ncbi:hypothetical protein B0H15DRAFT_763103, partial [Mycena belliarum]
WATPAGRLAMDTVVQYCMYFKTERADEEIHRLNIEIRRFWTYMEDEERFLWREEHGDDLAHQVRRYCWRRARFNAEHCDRLRKLEKVPGFTGSLQSG